MTRVIRSDARPMAAGRRGPGRRSRIVPDSSISRWPATVVSGLFSSWETVEMSWLL